MDLEQFLLLMGRQMFRLEAKSAYPVLDGRLGIRGKDRFHASSSCLVRIPSRPTDRAGPDRGEMFAPQRMCREHSRAQAARGCGGGER